MFELIAKIIWFVITWVMVSWFVTSIQDWQQHSLFVVTLYITGIQMGAHIAWEVLQYRKRGKII